MIFITGGAYQGKYAYAQESFSKEYCIINAYQDIVRRQMREGKNPVDEAEALLERCGGRPGELSGNASGDAFRRLVIICDEVGSGVVPMDAFERDYREVVGRVSCLFAKRAERVLRLVCGIPVTLKDGSVEEDKEPEAGDRPTIRYRIRLIRHGATKGNLEGRYVGRTDKPLLAESREALRNKFKEKALPEPDILLASPMKRCVETAELLFPNAQIRTVDGFRECDFGKFEYMNYEELNGNPAYQRYIDSGGETAFPDGEDRKGFQDRCVRAFTETMQGILSEEIRGPQNAEIPEKARTLTLVVHGGTIMALMDAFARPHRDYFDWRVGNGEGCEAWLDCSCIGTEGRFAFSFTEPEKII